MGITPREIEDRMEDAARTLRRLPHPPGSGPRGFASFWPEYVREARLAYGYHEAPVRVVPSARDIEQMEETLGWLLVVSDPDDRRILWMRAEGARWRTICFRVGCVRSTAHRRWLAGPLSIAKHLNRNRKSRDAAD
jgi:hypothetical protein